VGMAVIAAILSGIMTLILCETVRERNRI
jgi:hypothetical protein